MTSNEHKNVNEYQQRANMWMARAVIVLVGVVLPYLFSLPGWMMEPMAKGRLQYYIHPLMVILLLGTGLIIWLPIFVGTLYCRRARYALAMACVGYAFPAYVYLELGYSRDAQTPIAYLFLPVYALPISVVGCVAVWFVERMWERRRQRLAKS